MDTPNPFQTPAAELQTPAATAPLRLYSINAVGLATFLGTSLAGSYMIAANLKALGRESEVKKAWYVGIGLLVLMMVLGGVLPESVPAMVFVLPPLFAMNAYARQLFGPVVIEHKLSKGPFFSLWRVAGISLLFMLAFVVALIPLVMLFNPA
ncbi:hypothetical protein PUP68_29635 [Pseudomonas chlororaphis]|uniref:hypothetical protein n=1 Tax=Pseudomonas chlororaphis TaxID=587753 RepID=UPI0006A5B429|nr:hypothetical protein [Pseudomonas chlororaphis]AZC33603.1 Permease of the major facilitator superfamily [Pseudomonas chlororaphis subsp. piscium]WDG81998.1 hypothetical protein PUP77_15225 [Pseudomonas chlororaphis]WDG84948.1 hypothetical protein PUP68_29635 [Pseudomonas chlororaphis]WDG91260.1 hypothetical protein PUP49_28995 [Pseudomonas chlororaphis]SDS25267.1 hypothetical protein SAMN05216585_1711 [Pseudomonas chlororaphis]